jgi:hypothetical protein
MDFGTLSGRTALNTEEMSTRTPRPTLALVRLAFAFVLLLALLAFTPARSGKSDIRRTGRYQRRTAVTPTLAKALPDLPRLAVDDVLPPPAAALPTDAPVLAFAAPVAFGSPCAARRDPSRGHPPGRAPPVA